MSDEQDVFQALELVSATRKMCSVEGHGEYEEKVHRLRGGKEITSPCPRCHAEKLAAESQQHRKELTEHMDFVALEAARIPSRYIGRKISDFVIESDKQRQEISVVKSYAKNITENIAGGIGMILIGAVGTGKTHILCALAQYAYSLKFSVRYTTVRDLLTDIRSTWSRSSERTERQVLDEFSGYDLLCIDEIGVQTVSENEVQLLTDVVDRRYRNKKATLIASNEDLDGIRVCLGDRAFDRIRGTSHSVVVMDWQSYRGRNPEHG